MRILVLSTGFLPAESFGGLPFSTYYLCRGLVQAGANVRVITTNVNGAGPVDVPADCWSEYEGLPVWYAKTAGGSFLFSPSTSRAIADAMPHVDCVINSGTLWSHAGLLSWRAAKGHGIPAITYVRGLLEPTAFRVKRLRKRVYWHLVAKRILQDSAAVVALNERERESIRRFLAGGRIDVIPNGAGLEGEAESRDMLDARIPGVAGRRYVLFLGRIHPVKGIDLLLRSASELRRELEDVRFVVAGPIERTFAGRWSELLRTHALEDAVIAPGPVKGVLKTTLLAHADVFILPSYGEGLPVAALEALLAGCPVVLTRQCNLPEVEEADAGIVIDPDADQLRHALRCILRDDRARRHMSANARMLANTRFNWRAIGERTLDLCRDVAGSGLRAY